MKKLSALFVILTLVFSLSAGVLAETPVTRIVFWHSMNEEAGVLLEKYVKDFNDTVGAQLGIEAEAVYQGSYAQATQKLNAILQAGNFEELPDVMQMDATGKVAYFTSGKAYTVDDLLRDNAEADVSGLLGAAMGNWNYTGVQLGVPFATSTTVTYYNKTVLGDAAPETFAEISAVTAPEGTVVYATVPNTPTLANWLGQLGSYVVNQKNGSEGSATELACIENGTLETFLTEWKALYQSGALQNYAGSTDEFVAGKLLIMTSSSSKVTSLLASIGGSFELGVAAYPRVNADAAFGATVSGSCLVMFDTGKQEAAWALESYLTSADVQADFAVGTGYIPSNSGALETEAWKQLVTEQPAYNVGLEQLMATPADMRSVTVGPSADFYYAIQDCVSEMLDSDLSAEETVEMMEDELGGLLTQYAMANP